MISGFWQKLGFWTSELINTWKNKKDWIWFHAVSVGELNAVWPLILEIKKKKPVYPIMISCTTNAGYNLGKKLTKEKDFLVFYFPFDLPWVINSLLNDARIKLLVIVETEIWPNIISTCHKKNIPVILVNARLSDKSFKNYSLLKFYFKKVINQFTEVLAQSENDANKFKKLGIDDKKVKIFGNIKFSNGKYNTYEQETTDKGLINIIFASTHKGEEEIAINVFKNLLNEFSNIRLIIAPRHIDRTQEIVNLTQKNNLVPILRTQNIKTNSPNEILILDTIGELNNYYTISQITVLGGTFTKVGGHNILEPIRANSYTIIGPYDFKIIELTKVFKERNAIVQVNSQDELASKIKEALLNKTLRENTIKNGLQIIKENANVFEQTCNQILVYL